MLSEEPAGATEIAVAARVSITDQPQLDPDDPRYPRSRLEKARRWLAQRPLSGMLTYLGAVAAALAALVLTHGLDALFNGNNLAQALQLDRVPFIGRLGILALVLALPLLPIAWWLIRVGRAAKADEDTEKDVLRLRASRRAIERFARPMAEAAGATAGRAEAERAVPELVTDQLVQLGIDLTAASAQREQAPPFDLAALPVPDTFIGRAADLKWVRDQLAPSGATAAITALGGLGGIGKTALAGVAVRELLAAGRFSGGVAVVVCRDLRDPQRDPQAILRAALARFLGGKEPEAETDAALADVARDIFKDRDALVVLDNVEPELNRELARVVAPLRAAGAALLLTARHDLPASAVPPGASRRLDVLDADEARALFTQLYEAGIGRPLMDGESPAVAAIVETLGRHTLAVRLAAVYAPGRDLAALARELAADPLRLPDDDETPRGVALVLGRSVAALPPEAQRLFAALSAFTALDVGRNAALALGAGLGLSDADAATALDTLARRALLDAAVAPALPAEGSDRERLRIHPLVKAHANDLLAEEDRAVAFHAVAAYYAGYANNSRTPDTARAADEENITGALEWAHTRGEDAQLVGLCMGMRNYWRDRGRTREALRYLPWGIEAAAQIARETGEKQDQHWAASLSLYYGHVLQNTGRLDAAERIYQQVLAYRQQEQNPREEAVVLGSLGQLAQQRGRLDEAERYLLDALPILREVRDRRGEGVDLGTLGQLARARGRLDEAERYLKQSLLIRREVRDRQGEGVDLAQLGLIAAALEHWDDAEGYYRQCLTLMRDVQDALNEATISLILGEFLITRRGNRTMGCPLLLRAVAIRHELGLLGEEEARETARRLGCGEESRP